MMERTAPDRFLQMSFVTRVGKIILDNRSAIVHEVDFDVTRASMKVT